MKKYTVLIISMLALFLLSCEERTGYYDKGQREIIECLTSGEWRQTYEHRPPFEPHELENDGMVYKFNANGSGSYKWVNWTDGSIYGEPVYFRWTFTNDNFAVIYIDKSECFLLIDKLTTSELWVYRSNQDPVLHPNQYNGFYKFENQCSGL